MEVCDLKPSAGLASLPVPFSPQVAPAAACESSLLGLHGDTGLQQTVVVVVVVVVPSVVVYKPRLGRTKFFSVQLSKSYQ